MLQKLINASVSPFRATPDTRFYFDHPSIESARQTVLRAVIRSEGPVAVLGGSGYGKSLLADLVADQLCQRLDIVMLQSARLSSRRALLQSILFELRLPYLDMSEGELRLSILDRLEPSPETAPEGVLILVDEAHTLHWKMLDELRLISNFTRNHQPRVKLVLFGNLRLEETLASPQLDSFNQRLAARCYLQPMTRSETKNYIQHQLRESGVDPISVITHEALNSVYSASEGIPRLVNQLMDHSIWLASNSAQSPISAALVNEAWSDLQQLPTPWTSGKNDQTAIQSTVEFGNLPDDDDDHEELGFAPEKTEASAIRKNEIAKLDEPLTVQQQVTSPVTTETYLDIAITSSTTADVIIAPTNALPVSQESSEIEIDLGVEGNNFFSAFHATTSNQFFSAIDDGSEDDKWRVKPEEKRHFELEITLPTPIGQAPLEPQATDSTPLSPLAGPGFNWFAPQAESFPLPATRQHDSSDEERIVSLMAEQQQYDAMGMWENDPPLTKPIGAQDKQSDKLAEKTSTVFGNDFDDEVVLAVDSPVGPMRSFTPPTVPQNNSLQANSTQNNSQLADQSDSERGMDYLTRMQKYADAITGASKNADSPTFQSCSSTEQCLNNPADDSLLADSLWCINVGPAAAANASDRPLEETIEDMASKLNFSAFSMEPFSIEQIPLEPTTKSIPYDSVRRGSNDEVYLMHRPLNSNSAANATNGPFEDHLDDDRDLLIVEEDIPVSIRTLDNKGSDQPVQKTTSYAQLFAKLRK